jgi:peroxiredoxin
VVRSGIGTDSERALSPKKNALVHGGICNSMRSHIIVVTVKKLRIALLGLTTLALAFTLACEPRASAQKAVRDGKDRKTAPEFELKDASGKVVHLADYKGKVVVLDFWATWCGPCGIEIPWFIDFQRKYKDRGFEVLGVSMDDDGWKAISPFVAEKKINYRILLGDDKTGDQYGGVEALPTTFVIDRDGRIASTHVGLANRKDFEDAIEKLLEAAPDVNAGITTRNGG